MYIDYMLSGDIVYSRNHGLTEINGKLAVVFTRDRISPYVSKLSL